MCDWLTVVVVVPLGDRMGGVRHSGSVTVEPARPLTPRTRGAEVLLVLGLSLGQSAVYALVSIIAKLTAEGPLSKQTATMNSSVSDRPWLDLTYQLLRITFALVPVLLAVHLINRDPGDAPRTLGLGTRRPGADLWWTVPILVLAAVQNAVLEETIVVGYLLTRLRELGWQIGSIIVASAVLRGSYHLYQGFGAFLGNVVMGVIFALFFLRTRRVMPLIIAHTLLDVFAFVGYALLPKEWLSWL